MSQFTVRPALSADLPAIHRLVGELAAFEKELPSFTASLDHYREQFADLVFQAHVAEERGGSIVGVALYFNTFSTWKGKMLWLEDFVVSADYRGRGIGQQLFAAFLAEARRRSCTMVKWQVLDWNDSAVSFYELQGAIIEKNWWNGKMFL